MIEHPFTRRSFLRTATAGVAGALVVDFGRPAVALKTGDYTVMGMEKLLALERKSLADLVAPRRFVAVPGGTSSATAEKPDAGDIARGRSCTSHHRDPTGSIDRMGRSSGR